MKGKGYDERLRMMRMMRGRGRRGQSFDRLRMQGVQDGAGDSGRGSG